MKIHDDHMFHGASLIQIAEDEHFTAINSFSVDGHRSRSAYLVNHNIGVYLKYASKPKGKYGEYPFTFGAENVAEIEQLHDKVENTFVCMVCVAGREICAIPYSTFKRLVTYRRNAAGVDEDQYVILATLPDRRKMRVYVNAPNTKGKTLGMVKIKRSAFPGVLFA